MLVRTVTASIESTATAAVQPDGGYLREIEPGIKDGAYIRVLPPPPSGCVVVMTLPSRRRRRENARRVLNAKLRELARQVPAT
jgi:hypothetical protein